MSPQLQWSCPECKGILTPWGNNQEITNQHVCDVCGYGKDSDTFDKLQNSKTIACTTCMNHTPWRTRDIHGKALCYSCSIKEKP